MDTQVQKIIPEYKKIYTDMIEKKFPYKKEELAVFLNKPILETIDVIWLNEKLFGKRDSINQKYRSYGKSDIFKILQYQKKHKLNNSRLAEHFKLSRNTVAKWKKMFPEKLF
jgi:hypothetical protein